MQVCRLQQRQALHSSRPELTVTPHRQLTVVKLTVYVGKVQCASLTAAAEVGMALESEAVASAVREADFERMQREAAESGIAGLQDALEKLRQKLKTSQVCCEPALLVSLRRAQLHSPFASQFAASCQRLAL